MSRDEFLSQLEYLLQDISEEEKADAIQYYRDYFEEAGQGEESRILGELGSPERTAAIIRADIDGSLESGGAFTDAGYQDERFRDPNLQIVKRLEPPVAVEDRAGGEKRGDWRRDWRRDRRLRRTILLAAAAVVLLPTLLSLAGGLIGILSGVAGFLFALAAGLGAVTLSLFLAGTLLLAAGMLWLFVEPAGGLLMAGTGILITGLGCLCLALSFAFYGRFLPYLVRWAVDGVSGLIHRRDRRSSCHEEMD